GGAGEAGVETSRGEVVVHLKIFGKAAAADAKVGAHEVFNRESGVFVQLFGNGFFVGFRKVGALLERVRVVAHGEGLHLLEEGEQLGGLIGQLVVVPGGGGVGG